MEMSEINVSSLSEGVRESYRRAAQHPDEEHPFPVGRDFAESVGYPAELLSGLLAVAVEAFAGGFQPGLVGGDSIRGDGIGFGLRRRVGLHHCRWACWAARPSAGCGF